MKMPTSTITYIIACVFLLHVVAAVEYDVGGDFGWNLPPNSTFFSTWVHNKTFFVGDKIVFKSNVNERHVFAEPETQADFDGCVNPGIVISTSSNITRNLLSPGRIYFICTVGNHCSVGMKFAIDVLAQPGTMSPPPPSSASSLRVGALASLAGFLLTII